PPRRNRHIEGLAFDIGKWTPHQFSLVGIYGIGFRIETEFILKGQKGDKFLYCLFSLYFMIIMTRIENIVINFGSGQRGNLLLQDFLLLFFLTREQSQLLTYLNAWLFNGLLKHPLRQSPELQFGKQSL